MPLTRSASTLRKRYVGCRARNDPNTIATAAMMIDRSAWPIGHDGGPSNARISLPPEEPLSAIPNVPSASTMRQTNTTAVGPNVMFFTQRRTAERQWVSTGSAPASVRANTSAIGAAIATPRTIDGLRPPDRALTPSSERCPVSNIENTEISRWCAQHLSHPDPVPRHTRRDPRRRRQERRAHGDDQPLEQLVVRDRRPPAGENGEPNRPECGAIRSPPLPGRTPCQPPREDAHPDRPVDPHARLVDDRRSDPRGRDPQRPQPAKDPPPVLLLLLSVFSLLGRWCPSALLPSGHSPRRPSAPRGDTFRPAGLPQHRPVQCCGTP